MFPNVIFDQNYILVAYLSRDPVSFSFLKNMGIGKLMVDVWGGGGLLSGTRVSTPHNKSHTVMLVTMLLILHCIKKSCTFRIMYMQAQPTVLFFLQYTISPEKSEIKIFFFRFRKGFFSQWYTQRGASQVVRICKKSPTK